MREISKGIVVLMMATIWATGAWAQTDVRNQLQAGVEQLNKGKYVAAFELFEKVNKQNGGNSEPCLSDMAMAKSYLGDESSAVKLAERALAAATSNVERADALGVRGFVVMRAANGDKRKLADAEDSFRKALEAEPKHPYFHLRIAEALFLQEKDEEGKKELTEFLAGTPTGANAETARKWMADPRRARLNFAPDFEVKTLDGQTVSLKSLAGKVVIVDFWATWCPPCRESIPELKELFKKYPDKLVILSVSADKDAAKWEAFVKSHNMGWKHYRDTDDHIIKAFGVHEFPTYFLIDKEGIIRERVMDLNPQQTLGSRIRGPLNKLMQ